ncbi:hypothetical protein ARMGADRAFT_1067851 [Armillaria gallica]|uniref:F-box domain-containing protein n=1 Tax=Armillaria gallica TaxID=47427 RepID=A0A2H3CNH1_ARMGA|nr:hypothetical protein ARMGADRAFT_1067851 [Armillaria gallica]
MRQSCNRGFVDLLPPYGKHQPQAPLKAFQDTNIRVAQILRESRTMLHPSEDAFISADILELERLQSFYDAQLQQVQYRAVTEALEARRSIRAPIRRLPRDVLIEIFHLVRHSWWQHVGDDCRWSPITPERQSSLRLDGPLWVLGRVCSFWRETLHTSPASWAQNVVVRTPFPKHAREIWQLYLKRTGEHPLTLQVVGDVGEPMEEEDETMSFFVQESCHRWKDVIIDVFTMRHMQCLEESISHLPMLQMIQIHILDNHHGNYSSDICLKAPQLRRAMLSKQGISQVKLPPCITHYSGRVTHPDDLRLLSRQSKLRVCHLKLRLSYVEPSVQVPVIMPHVQCLFVEEMGTLDLVTLPRLESLVLCMSPRERFSMVTNRITVSEWIAHFLQRSGCYLRSLTMGHLLLTYCSGFSIHKILTSDTFSTLSFLKVELQLDRVVEAENIVQSLTPRSDAPVLLPNLYHLVLCMMRPVYLPSPDPAQWHSIVNMIRARRDAGSLKIIEVQFLEWEWEIKLMDRMKADIRALTGETLEMRVEEWNPPNEEHWSLWSWPQYI